MMPNPFQRWASASGSPDEPERATLEYSVRGMPALFWAAFLFLASVLAAGIVLPALSGEVYPGFIVVWGAFTFGLAYLEGWQNGFAFVVVGDVLVWRAPLRRRVVPLAVLSCVIVRDKGRGSAFEAGRGNLLYVLTPDQRARTKFERAVAELSDAGLEMKRF